MGWCVFVCGVGGGGRCGLAVTRVCVCLSVRATVALAVGHVVFESDKETANNCVVVPVRPDLHPADAGCGFGGGGGFATREGEWKLALLLHLVYSARAFKSTLNHRQSRAWLLLAALPDTEQAAGAQL